MLRSHAVTARSSIAAPASLFAGLVLTLFAAAPAEPAATVTPITGPTVISEPGDYVVTSDFTVTDPAGDAIVIRASNVRLSLGGRTITGPGNKQGRGIVLEGATNVSVEGGSVRTFGIGIALIGTRRSSVSNVAVEGADEFADPPAIAPQIGVLLVNSAMNTIRGNRLERVNLGIFVRGAQSYENRIQQNAATAGFNGLLGICYNPAAGEGAVGPQRDQVQQNTIDGFPKGIQASDESTNNRFVANVIRFTDVAYEDRNGSNQFVGNRSTDLTP